MFIRSPRRQSSSFGSSVSRGARVPMGASSAMRRSSSAPIGPRLLPWIVLLGTAMVVYVGLQIFTNVFTGGSDEPATTPEAATLAELHISPATPGDVEVQFHDVAIWNKAAGTVKLAAGDRIRTASGATAEVVFFDHSAVRVAPESELRILDLTSEPERSSVRARLDRGRLWARVLPLVSEDSRFEVETVNALASVRGTAFDLEVESGDEDETTILRTAEGTVSLAAIERSSGSSETRVLQAADVQEGYESRIATSDLLALGKKAKKLELRPLSTLDRVSSWREENERLDARHLTRVQKALEAELAESADVGVIRRLLDSELRAREARDRELLLRIRLLLKLLPEPAPEDVLPGLGSGSDSGSGDFELMTESGALATGTGQLAELQPIMPAPRATRTYTVKSGDFISLIALRENIDWMELAELNHLIPPYNLEAGQVLLLPDDENASGSSAATTGSPVTPKPATTKPAAASNSPTTTSTGSSTTPETTTGSGASSAPAETAPSASTAAPETASPAPAAEVTPPADSVQTAPDAKGGSASA